jgi:superfamily II DNA or RNA helicase
MFPTSGPDKEAGIVISTYNMMAYQGNRSEETEKLIRSINQMDWGLMILDEV